MNFILLIYVLKAYIKSIAVMLFDLFFDKFGLNLFTWDISLCLLKKYVTN